jgi:hypothetical protein
MSLSTITTISSNITNYIIQKVVVSMNAIFNFFSGGVNDLSYQLINTNGLITHGTTALNDTNSTNKNLDLSAASGITIMLRVKLTTVIDYTAGVPHLIAVSHNNTWEDGTLRIMFRHATGGTYPPDIFFGVLPLSQTGTGNNLFITTLSYNMSTAYNEIYYHCAMTIIPTNATGNYMTARYYRNGVYVNTLTWGNTSTNHWAKMANLRNIGLLPAARSFGTQSNLKATCNIKDFRVYDSALSDSQITAIYNEIF